MSISHSSSDVYKLISSAAAQEYFKTASRWPLLPDLFQIKGEPYSLEDYPQFRVLYTREYAPEEIWMCGRQVAKSTNLSRSEILDAMQVANFQILYVAPLQSQSYRYSSLYLKDAINTCPPARKMQQTQKSSSAAAIVKSVMHQSFINGSSIQMTYAKTSADRARGITADRLR